MTGARKVRVALTQQHRPFIVDLLLIKQQRPEWTYAQLGYAIGVDRRTISRWLRGDSEPTDLAVRQIKAVKAAVMTIPAA